MRRRHLLALVILALVVATVSPWSGWVWDALTLRTVEEERWPHGGLCERVRENRWENGTSVRERWWENGQREHRYRTDSSGRRSLKEWTEAGTLCGWRVYVGGTLTISLESTLALGNQPCWMVFDQDLSCSGQIIEWRASPPWFTEQEILQSVAGVQE